MTMDRTDPAAQDKGRTPEALHEATVKLIAETTRRLDESGLGQKIAERLAGIVEFPKPNEPRPVGNVEWMAAATGTYETPTDRQGYEDPQLRKDEISLTMVYREDGGDWRVGNLLLDTREGTGEHGEYTPHVLYTSGPPMDVLAPQEVHALSDILGDVAEDNKAAAANGSTRPPFFLSKQGTPGYEPFLEHVTEEGIQRAPYNGGMESKEITAARVLQRQFLLDQLYSDVQEELVEHK